MSRRAAASAALLLAALLLPAHARVPDAKLRAAKHAAEAAGRADSHPRNAFLEVPEVHDLSMSPDGRWLAYRHDVDGREELWLREIDGAARHRVLTDSFGTQLHWSGDGRRIWLPDATGLGVFDIETRTGRRIVRFDQARRQSFLAVDRKAVDFALLREKLPADGRWLYRYLAVDASGKTHVVHETDRALQGVLLDAHGRLRYAAGYDGEAFDTVLWRVGGGSGGDDREEIMRCPLPKRCRPVAWREDTVWALAHHGPGDDGDLVSLHRLDGSGGDWRRLHSDPRGIADAVSLLMQPDGTDWLAIAYRPDRVQWHGRTGTAAAALDELQQQLPGANLELSASRDGKRWLVQAKRADWSRDRYFLHELDRSATAPLFEKERRGALAPEQLAEAVAVDWRGRDGMQLHGYAYLPKGIPLDSAPLIAMLHGGPYNRWNGEHDAVAQLLANRGYIVFKPNFRASTGHGVEYATAARGDFGKHGVLEDILAGIDHLLANGVGDPDRQAVTGHSFGGYASLLAVTHHPDRFAFAVASAAPVDLAWTMAEIAVEGGSALSADGPPVEILFPGYGVPYGDPAWHERMHRDSPLAHAGARRTPVYLWAGANDDRVALESLVRLVAESNADFKPVLLIDPDAGHGPRKHLNVEALAWLIEAGANRHFGGGVTPPSKALKAFLGKHLRTGKAGLLQ